MLRPLGGGDDEVAGVFPALEQVSPATFEAPDPGDVGHGGQRRAAAHRAADRVPRQRRPVPLAGRLAVEPRAYQLVPLLMALRQDTVRLLIADDVGIGKTIEAGLIAAELLAQGDATGLAVLCAPGAGRAVAAGAARRSSASTPSWCCPARSAGWSAGCCTASRCSTGTRTSSSPPTSSSAPGRGEQFWHGCPDLVIVDEAHTCVDRRHRRPVPDAPPRAGHAASPKTPTGT